MAPSGHLTKVTHLLLQLLKSHTFIDTNGIHFVNQMTKVTQLGSNTSYKHSDSILESENLTHFVTQVKYDKSQTHGD